MVTKELPTTQVLVGPPDTRKSDPEDLGRHMDDDKL
jgi:hypothetical protein